MKPEREMPLLRPGKRWEWYNKYKRIGKRGYEVTAWCVQLRLENSGCVLWIR